MKRILAFLLACSMVLCLMGCQTSPETSVPTQGQLETPSTSTSGTPDTQPTNPDPEPSTPVHEHTWKDATCVRPRSCAECGQTEGVPHGHSWLDATTTAPKTCSVCGAQDGDVIFDIPEDVPVFIPENECFEENTTVIVDAITGGESLERIDAVMGDYAEKYVAYSFTATKDEEIVQPTGKLTVTFAIPEGYSDNITVFYVAEDGTLEKMEGTVDPVARTITVELSHFSDYIVVDEGSAEHDHVPVAGATSVPTCVDPGYTTYSCDCGYTYLADRVEPTGHSYGRGVITEPSCIQDGKTTYTCHCGHSYDEPIPATGHTWSDATCTDPRTCSVCKFTEGTAAGHTWVDATCTAPKTCSVCQATKGDPLGHTWADPTCTDPKTCSACQATDGDPLGHKWMDANCTTAKTCSVCQAIEGDPLGHKWTDATCTSPKTCSVCQATEGAVTEHPWDEGVVTKEATEEAEGEKLYTCTACKTTRTEVIPKLDHVHLYDKVEVTAPTCTEKGFTTHTCRCGDTKVDSETPATGHSYESKVTAPTCTEKGYTTHTCHCGDTKVDSETPATGHSYESKVTAPTCTEKGFTTHTCHCGDTYTDAETAATGHTYDKGVVTAPTCIDKGFTTYACYCGHTRTDNETPATGHKWGEATCTAPKTCTICSATEGKSLGHNWQAATCTEPGICSRCAARQGEPHGHSCEEGTCAYCGVTFVSYSKGLEFRLSWDKTYYSLSGIGTCTDTEIVIPPTYNGLPVQEIGASAFRLCKNITSVIIPEGVTKIGTNAFHNCSNLVSVTIPNSVTEICGFAFYSCKNLASIAIPDSVTTIGNSAFGDCKKLKEIILSSKAKFVFVDGVLYDNPVTEILWISDHIPANLTVLNGVITISGFAGYTNLTGIILPDSVTTIKGGAFKNCTNLTSITLSDSLTDIGNNAFAGCANLKSFILSPNAKLRFSQGIFYDNPVTEIVHMLDNISGDITILEGVTKIPLFPDCANLQSVTIPSTATSVADGAFSKCVALKQIRVAKGNDSFHADEYGVLYKNKTIIAVPGGFSGDYVVAEGVTMGRGTFANIPGLTGITILSTSSSTIPAYCFEGCTGLTQIIIPYGIYTIGEGAFRECVNLEKVVLPQSLMEIQASAFLYCTNLKNIIIPPNVRKMGLCVFESCSQLTTVAFTGDAPNGMSNVFLEVKADVYYPVGNSTWTSDKTQYCGGTIVWKTYDPATEGKIEYVLSSDGSYYILAGKGTYQQSTLVIPSTYNGLPVREIARGAFTGDSQITAVTIPGSVVEIGAYSFDGCTALTNVTLEKGVKTIGAYAFYRCPKLTGITIPDSVTFIQDYALGNHLKRVHITDLRRWLEIEFSSYDANPLSDEDVTLWLNSYLFTTSDFTIPEGTTRIGSYALYGFQTSVLTIPASVKQITNMSFAGCTNLERIVLEGDNSFRYVDGILYDNPVTKILWISPKISGYITILNGVTSIPYGAFGNTNITGITIPESVTSIEGAAFAGSAITSIVIPDSVTSMGAYVFSNCAQLVSVKLPKNLTIITLQMFEKCVKLESITIPDGVTIIEDQAFVDCDSLKTITIPGSVVTIDMEAFLSCDNLTEVIIEEGVERIEWFAFKNCTKLTSVIIPTSVTWMTSAFCNTRNLTIAYLGTKAQWKKVGTGCCVNEIEGSEEGQLEMYKVPVQCKDGTI